MNTEKFEDMCTMARPKDDDIDKMLVVGAISADRVRSRVEEQHGCKLVLVKRSINVLKSQIKIYSLWKGVAA